MEMPTQQILIRLPENVAATPKAAVPARKCNKFVAELVAPAVARHEAALAKIATAVPEEEKNNPEITREMRDGDATLGDGMEDEHGTHAKPEAR
jgi:hypothetical protein